MKYSIKDLPPEDAEVFERLKIARFFSERRNLSGVKIWRGKQSKPFANYVFHTEKDRDEFIATTMKDETDSLQMRKEIKESEKKRTVEMNEKIQVGTILYTSWGYDQTNIDFYQVIEKKGSFAWIREICSAMRETGMMCGECRPLPNRFIGNSETMKKRIGPWGIKITSYAHATSTDEKTEHYTSSYA